MKKLKKILICAAACVTACSFTALTACADNTPGDGLSSDVTVTEQMSAEALGAQLAKFENQSTTSLTVSGGLKMTKMGEETVDMDIATLSAKANLTVGNADVSVGLNSLIFGGDQDAPSTGNKPLAQAEGDAEEGSEEGGEEGGEIEMMEMNVYLRDWIAFYPDMDETGDGDYNYKDLAAAVSESANMVIEEVVTALTGGFMQDNTMLFTLANSTDSILVDETTHTITLDINKMVYGLYGYIKQIVNNLTEYTTLSGLLKCSAVRYYVEAYLGDMTAEELYENLMEAIFGGEEGTTPYAAEGEEVNPFAAIMPNEGEKAYDYILRVLGSDDFAMIMGSENPIGATKIVDMIGEDASETLETIKSMVTLIDGMNIFTETSITIPELPGMAPAYAGTSISDLKLVYIFDEQDTLLSVDLSGKVGMTMEETAVEMALELSVEFAAEAITEFENIGGYTVNVPDVGGSYVQRTVADVLKNLREA